MARSAEEKRVAGREAMRRWRAKQPKKIRQPRPKMSDEERKKRQKESEARYIANNHEKYLAKQRRWRENNHEKRVSDLARRAAEWQIWVQAIKLESGCVDCGYAEHAEALDFDHRPGTEKFTNVSCMISYARERVLEEIAKCEVVCANCHRVRTAERRAS